MNENLLHERYLAIDKLSATANDEKLKVTIRLYPQFGNFVTEALKNLPTSMMKSY